MLVSAEAPSAILNQSVNVYVKDWSELILQDTGNRTDATMSQKVITDLLATKVDKSTIGNILYATDNSANQKVIRYSKNAESDSIAQRNAYGRLVVSEAKSDNEATTLLQVKKLLDLYGLEAWKILGLTQGDQKYSIVQKRIKTDGSEVSTEAYQRGTMSVGGDTVAGDPNGDPDYHSFAFAANENNKAIPRASAAFGRYNTAHNIGEFVCGDYANNDRNPSTVFAVGTGLSDSQRKTGFEVRKDGYCYSNGKALATEKMVQDNTITKQQVPYIVYTMGSDKDGNIVEETIPYRFQKDSIINPEYTVMFQPMYNGRLYTRDPEDDYHAANKKFVNEGLSNKYDKAGGIINGNVRITGDLIVNGTEKVNNVENLNVKDVMIYANSTGAALTKLAGLGIKTSSTDSYGIVYDTVSDSVKLGLGKVDTTGTFTFNTDKGNSIATRADNSLLTNNHLLMWDSVGNKLVDSGKTIDSFLPADVSNAEITIDNYRATYVQGAPWYFDNETLFSKTMNVSDNLSIKDYISILDQNIAEYLKIYFPVQTGTVLLRPNDLPTETSLITVSSTGTHAYKKVSELVDTTSAQILSSKKTWGTRTGSLYKVVEISSQNLTAEIGGKNPNAEVSPETYTRTSLGGLGISQTYKESGRAAEYYSSFMFPTYKEGSQGTYYFSMAPYDNLTADSVIVTGTDRKPVWKPLSEFITSNNFNIGNGTGQGSLIQTNVKSSDNTPYTNIASGSGSVSLGKGTKALGNSDFVIGQNTTDDTSGSLVGGINSSNTDNSNYCLVFGNNINNLYAPHSFLFGKDLENSAANVIILGDDIVNPLKNAFLIGKGLRSQNYLPYDSEDGIIILGRYNKRATQGEDADGTIFIIGNGTSDIARSNAIKLSAAKGLECFIEPTTDNGVVRGVELNTKLNKPTNPTEASVVTLTSTGTVGTKKLSEFATSITTPVTIPWSNLKSSEGILDKVRTITTGLYEHSLYLRFIYNDWNAEVFMTLLSNTDAEITDYTAITNILGTTFYHEASGIITSPVGGENEYASGQIQNISHNGVKVLIPN